MKKIIVAALSVILGTFGYTVVDQAIEDRVANLEAKVSIQQSIIDEFNIDDYDLRLASDMPVGTKMLCIPSEPTVYTLENGIEVQIDSFTNTVVEHRELGKPGIVGYNNDLQYAESLFQTEIKGKTDPSYAGKYIEFRFVINTEGLTYVIDDVINSDGTFCVKQNPKGFAQEFVSEIRQINIKNYSLTHTTTRFYTTTTKSSYTTTHIYPTSTAYYPTTSVYPVSTAPNYSTTAYYPISTTTNIYETTQTSTSSNYIINSGYCGDYATWTLYNNGDFIINGTGKMYDFSGANLAPWYNNRSSIKHVIINSGITSVGEFSFYNCSQITEVVLPEGLLNIGYSAFFECFKLTNINLPSTLTSIGMVAFQYSNIRSIVIPSSVTSVSFNSFKDCYNLSSVQIENGVKYISDGAFYGCKSLNNVTIPESVISIGDDAFSGCTSLNNIKIGNNVESIGNNAFYNCTNLTDVYIGVSLKSVGKMAFASCGNIKDVYYSGTNEQWDTISFADGNARLTDATIHFEN